MWRCAHQLFHHYIPTYIFTAHFGYILIDEIIDKQINELLLNIIIVLSLLDRHTKNLSMLISCLSHRHSVRSLSIMHEFVHI